MAISDRLRDPFVLWSLGTTFAGGVLVALALGIRQQAVWWPGLLLLAAGVAMVLALLLSARRDGVRLTCGALAAVLVVGGGAWAVHPAPLGAPGWKVDGTGEHVIGRAGDVLVLSEGGRDVATGEQRWADGRVVAVVDDVAIVAPWPRIQGLDAKTGRRLWDAELDRVGDGVDVAVTVAADGVVVFNRFQDGHNAGGFALDVETGEMVWGVGDGWLSARARDATLLRPESESFVVHGHGRAADDRRAQVRAVATGAVVADRVRLQYEYAVRGNSLIVLGLGDAPRGTALDGSGDRWTWSARDSFLEDYDAHGESVGAGGRAEIVDLSTGRTRVVAVPDGWTVEDTLDGPWLALLDGLEFSAWNPHTDTLVELTRLRDLGDVSSVRIDADDSGLVAAYFVDDRIGRRYAHVVVADGAHRVELDWTFSGNALVEMVAGVGVLRDSTGVRVVPLG